MNSKLTSIKRILQVFFIILVFILGIASNIGSQKKDEKVVEKVLALGLFVWVASGGAGNVPSEVFSIVSGAGQGTATKPPDVLIPFSSNLTGLAVPEDNKYLLAIDKLNNSVTIFDIQQRTTAAIVDVGAGPRQIRVSNEHNLAYVSNELSNTVSVINLETLSIQRTISVGHAPVSLSVNDNNNYLFVANKDDNNISVINTVYNSSVGTIAVGSSPESIILDSNGETAFVMNTQSASISLIDTTSLLVNDTISLSSRPYSIAITPDDKKLYVATADDVSVVDLNSHLVTKHLDAGVTPAGIGISLDGKRAYVTTAGNLLFGFRCNSGAQPPTMAVIDVEQDVVLTKNLEVNGLANGLFISKDSKKIYAPSRCSASMAVINADAIPGQISNAVKTIALPAVANAIIGSRDRKTAYLALGDSIATVDVATDDISHFGSGRGEGPMAFAIDANTNELVMTLPNRNQIAIFDIVNYQFLAFLDVGSKPASIAIDNNKAYIANYGSKNISIVNLLSNRVIKTIDGGALPFSLLSSPANDQIWLANGQYTLKYIDTVYDTLVDTSISTDLMAPFAMGLTADESNFISISNFNVITTSTSNFTSPQTTSISFTDPTSMVITPNNRYAFVANHNSTNDFVLSPSYIIAHKVSVIDLLNNTLYAEIQLNGRNPTKLVMTPDGSKAYVISPGDRSTMCSAQGSQPTSYCATDNRVSVIDIASASLLRTLYVGNGPSDIAIDPYGNKVVVSNYYSNTASIIDTATDTVTTQDVGQGPSAVIISPNGNKAFVACSVGESIYYFDL